MEIIHQLGINQTAFVQFAIFICIFFFLNLYVFTPYYAALAEREKRTLGGEDLALEFHKKTTELHSEYQLKTKEVTSKIKSIYEAQRNDAMKDYDIIVSKAREEAGVVLDTNNKKIAQAVQSAASALKLETTNVAVAITQKLLGK
jgi:F-type H+-transporting ATPase subunit b